LLIFSEIIEITMSTKAHNEAKTPINEILLWLSEMSRSKLLVASVKMLSNHLLILMGLIKFYVVTMISTKTN
jgi:hypothetical protein